jgi:hypothetical protein
MLTNQISKSTLAKLLATENINVVYQKTSTASFNVATRTLTLPLLNDMTNEMEDLFIGHEVGHALETPTDYGDINKTMPKNFHSFLNVVEDARIERMIKDRYPGIRKSFNIGYRQFMDRDFFNLKNKDISSLLLIDRINLYFKVGPFLQVDFNETENEFIARVAECKTFDDVVSIAKDLYEYCQKEMEQKQQEQQLSSDDLEFDDYEEDDSESSDSDIGNSFDESDSDDGNASNNNASSEYDEDEEGDETSSGWSHETSNKDIYDGEVKSITDENLKKALENLTETKEVNNGKLDTCKSVNYSKLIISYKDIVGKIYDKNNSYESYYDKSLITEFEKTNKNAISYLVKEFEMRKKAAELKRTTVADTGVLDTNKLHTYKFNDDIFRKIGSTPAGKNHGIVMFIDWSGSMTSNMSGTIEQLITLTTFCRKVNIPFEVYAFSTGYKKGREDFPINVASGTLMFDEPFNLLNFFSSKMKNSEYRMMANDLLNFGNSATQQYSGLRSYSMDSNFSLGGTPLNATIFAASEIVNRFRKGYKSEIVDVVFLTDGCDTDTLYSKGNDFGGMSVRSPSRYSVSYITDEETKKKYRVGEYGVTPVLLQILKDRTNCNLIGFYILNGSKNVLRNEAGRFGKLITDEEYKVFRSEKFMAIDSYGYDQYFIIPGADNLKIEDDSLDDLVEKNEVSTRKLKTAFLKLNRGRLTNRVLLSKVIEEIA